MADRVAAFPVKVGEAMVARINAHIATYREQWLNVPNTVEFGLRSQWETGSFPLVGVTIPALDDQTAEAPFSSTGGRAELRIEIYAYIKGGEVVLHEFVADIRRAFADVELGRQLGGVLSSGVMFFDGWTAGIDDDGLGCALIGMRALFDWSITAA